MFVFRQEKKGHKHLLITDCFVLFHVLKKTREQRIRKREGKQIVNDQRIQKNHIEEEKEEEEEKREGKVFLPLLSSDVSNSGGVRSFTPKYFSKSVQNSGYVLFTHSLSKMTIPGTTQPRTAKLIAIL